MRHSFATPASEGHAECYARSLHSVAPACRFFKRQRRIPGTLLDRADERRVLSYEGKRMLSPQGNSNVAYRRTERRYTSYSWCSEHGQ